MACDLVYNPCQFLGSFCLVSVQACVADGVNDILRPQRRHVNFPKGPDRTSGAGGNGAVGRKRLIKSLKMP